MLAEAIRQIDAWQPTMWATWGFFIIALPTLLIAWIELADRRLSRLPLVLFLCSIVVAAVSYQLGVEHLGRTSVLLWWYAALTLFSVSLIIAILFGRMSYFSREGFLPRSGIPPLH